MGAKRSFCWLGCTHDDFTPLKGEEKRGSEQQLVDGEIVGVFLALDVLGGRVLFTLVGLVNHLGLVALLRGLAVVWGSRRHRC